MAPKQEYQMKISDDVETVNISKVNTRLGARIELSDRENRYNIRLDPLELESLTWQDPTTFEDFIGSSPPLDVGGNPKTIVEDIQEETNQIKLSNEFAEITMYTNQGTSGETLKITSPRLGTETCLTPLAVKSLIYHDHDTFSELLNTPFGGDHE